MLLKTIFKYIETISCRQLQPMARISGGSRPSEKKGGGQPDPEIRRWKGGGGAFEPQFGLKMRGGGGGGTHGALPWIRH